MADRPANSGSGIRSIKNITGQMPRATGELNGDVWSPPPLSSLNDTGLNLLSIADLVLKVLYFGGYLAGHAIADIVKLPYTGVLEDVMEFLKREKMVEVRGAGGLGEAGYQFVISQRGAEKAREAIDQRLRPLGFEVSRVMIGAIEMPPHVKSALEAVHERQTQAENEANALSLLQQVVSQFSDADMQRLIELERIRNMGQHGVILPYPTLFEADRVNGHAYARMVQ